MLLDDELKKRNLNINDYNLAIKDAKIIQADRDAQKKSIKRKIQFHLIYLTIIAIFFSILAILNKHPM